MGNEAMSAQMTRLLQILLLLPRFPKFLSVEQMHRKLSNEGIDVSVRTVQRDMNVVESVFGGRIGVETYEEFCESADHHVFGDSDRSNHWFWTQDAPSIHISGLTVNQALTLCLLEKYLSRLLPGVTLNNLRPFFDEATNTLQSMESNPLVEWPNKIAIVQPTQPLLMPEVNEVIHADVSEALLDERQLDIAYRRFDGVVKEYRVNPLGLVLRNGSLYLIARKEESRVIRIFALHRIRQVQQLDVPAFQPDDFDLQRFIDEGNMGFDLSAAGAHQTIKLKALFDEISANHLSESRLSDDQTIERIDASCYLITATVQESEQLFWWLLSFGCRVEVLEPIALRKKMTETVKMLAEKYGLAIHQRTACYL